MGGKRQPPLRLLKLLKSVKPEDRTFLIQQLGEEATNAIGESFHNLLSNPNLNLKKSTKRKLRHEFADKSVALRYISNRSKPWMSRRRKIAEISTSGRGFPLILASLIPAAVDIISRLVKKK